MENQRLILFGTGGRLKYEKEKHSQLFMELNITAYLDNNDMLWGNLIDGVPIVPPSEIKRMEYEKIILMADYVKAMWEQLLSLGVTPDKIFLWEQFLCMDKHGIFTEYGKPYLLGCNKKRVLLISTGLDYNGGTVAALNAAKALNLQGYAATISAPCGNMQLIQEMAEQGMHIVLNPAICYPKEEETDWIRQFDFVIVNVFQMLRCACIISRLKPVIWWIHESSEKHTRVYSLTKDNHWEYDSLDAIKHINIFAVSRKAQENFNYYYNSRINGILPCGIPDTYLENGNKESSKQIFAVIGVIYPLKAQEIFLDAIGKLGKSERKNTEFWIIGKGGDVPYSGRVYRKARMIPEVKVYGELTREQMQEVYRKIDTVVCPSLEETLSLTVVEGMMLGKICIATDATGIADYIEDRTNGLLCRAGSVESLYEKMKWVLDNPHRHSEIRKRARRTYEKYFTMEKLGTRLQKVLEDTEQGYILSGKMA